MLTAARCLNQKQTKDDREFDLSMPPHLNKKANILGVCHTDAKNLGYQKFVFLFLVMSVPFKLHRC